MRLPVTDPSDQIDGIIDIFLKSPQTIHILRAIEPNLRTGTSFLNSLLTKGDTTQCVAENSPFNYKCRRIGSKKQLSEAIATYEDEVVNNGAANWDPTQGKTRETGSKYALIKCLIRC